MELREITATATYPTRDAAEAAAQPGQVVVPNAAGYATEWPGVTRCPEMNGTYRCEMPTGHTGRHLGHHNGRRYTFRNKYSELTFQR